MKTVPRVLPRYRYLQYLQYLVYLQYLQIYNIYKIYSISTISTMSTLSTLHRVTVRNQDPSGGGGSQESQVSFPRQSDSPGDIIISTDEFL